MEYQKPQVFVVRAVTAVQGGKGNDMIQDSPDYHTNNAAYEADE